jgi:hypothetical protein
VRATYVPDAEVHARYVETGLTKWPLDEIARAAAEMDAARATYYAICGRAGDALQPFDPIWGTRRLDDCPAAVSLYALVGENGPYPPATSSAIRNSFPVNKWDAAARWYRRMTANVERAIADLDGADSEEEQAA